MSETMLSQSPSVGIVPRHRSADRRIWPVVAVGVFLLALGLAWPGSGVRVAGLAAGVAVLAAALTVWLAGARHRLARHGTMRTLRAALAHDVASVVVTDRACRSLHANPSAIDRLGPDAGARDLVGVLYAAPLAQLRHLLDRADTLGVTREDRASRNGQVRLTVTRCGAGLYQWRLEDITPDRAASGCIDIALPVAVLDAQDRLVSANAPLRALTGRVPDTLHDLIADLPLRDGKVHLLRGASGPHRARIIAIGAEGAGRELYFLPPEFGGSHDRSDLFDTLPVPLLKLTRDGQILLSNRGARHLIRNPIAPGTRLPDVLSGLGRPVRDWLEDAASGRGLNRSEFLQVTASETDLFVQVSLKRFEEDGETLLLAVLTDATELKTLEAQFVQSQKMQAIGQLAGGVAHDFNNLLTAISGHCDLLLLRHDQNDPEYGELVQIHQNANRAASLVGQLLAFSRKQTLQPEIIDLQDTMSELTHLLNRLVGERVHLVLRHGEGLPPIRVDKRQVEQVIMNLVVNARDAMPEGGEITIETEAVTLKGELRRNRAVVPSGRYVLVKVIDRGIGIPPEKITKIFEPFYTTKKTGEGTGLGLSTAYGIIKQTGGFIFADSTPGTGTVFSIYLPAQAHEARPEPALPAPAPRPASVGGVVLLVEDEAPVRAFASRALRLHGLTVLEAENAEQALELLTDDALKVDVFVTDVVMPGLDGPTWVRQALRKRPDARVVFVSGYAEDALSDHQVDIPNSVFLPKPFSLQDLTATVQRQVA
jgi:two-component system cell cycle sensor histidine kinase/response regulator CckA